MIFIDLSEFQCPVPLVKIKLLIQKMAQGEQLQVLLSDIGSRKDVPTYLEKKGYQLESLYKKDGKLSLIITK